MAQRGRPRHPDVLTPRQWEVLRHVREGLTNEQIAERLGISRDGVKFHVSEIITKLGVRKRGEAAEWSREPNSEPARPSAMLRWPSPSLRHRRRASRGCACRGRSPARGTVAVVVTLARGTSRPPGITELIAC